MIDILTATSLENLVFTKYQITKLSYPNFLCNSFVRKFGTYLSLKSLLVMWIFLTNAFRNFITYSNPNNEYSTDYIIFSLITASKATVPYEHGRVRRSRKAPDCAGLWHVLTLGLSSIDGRRATTTPVLTWYVHGQTRQLRGRTRNQHGTHMDDKGLLRTYTVHTAATRTSTAATRTNTTATRSDTAVSALECH